jgi:hypothetical protein
MFNINFYWCKGCIAHKRSTQKSIGILIMFQRLVRSRNLSGFVKSNFNLLSIKQVIQSLKNITLFFALAMSKLEQKPNRHTSTKAKGDYLKA